MEGTFPPLAGNPNIADPNYVIDVIRNGKQGPITVDSVSYDGVMPPVGNLTDAQIEAVAAYVVELGSATPSAGPSTTVPAATTGDADRGEDLFGGRMTLAAGGATCSSCHAAGPYGGATLGPDLTDVASRLGGEAGLTGWLAAPPSPTMQPIFGVHPLDEAEIADLVAFLVSVDGTAPARGPDVMLIGSAVGLAVLFVAMAIFFKRPRGAYVDQLRRT